MDFSAGGDMLQKIEKFRRKKRNFSEKMAWRYFIQMLKGLKCLHDLNIFHRDIKSANVFISGDQKTVKIGDMNVSKIAKKKLAKT